MMELKQTVEMMNSADYKERFKAEYMQVVIRYKKLANMLEKWGQRRTHIYSYLSEKHLQYAGKSNDGLYCCSGSKGSYGKS